MEFYITIEGLDEALESVRNIRKALKTINLATKAFAFEVVGEIIEDSPRGETGNFSSNWNVSFPTLGAGNLAMISFSNNLPYAEPLESGVTPGRRPWPSVGPRTTLYKGRIYSSQAPGGTAERVIEKKLTEFNELLGSAFENIF